MVGSRQAQRARASQRLPVDEYVLQRGQFQFGADDNHSWSVSFSEGPEFCISEGTTAMLELGQLRMAVRSIDERKRYRPDAEDRDYMDQYIEIMNTQEKKDGS